MSTAIDLRGRHLMKLSDFSGEEITYLHPLLEKSLGKTLGVPLFQEQLMQMAMDCAGFDGSLADQLRRAMGSKRSPERIIQVEWGRPKAGGDAVYPVDVSVEAADRQGLLRDISEVFAKEKMNVIGVQSQSVKGTAWMTFTVEIADSQRLGKVLAAVGDVKGVTSARRR